MPDLLPLLAASPLFTRRKINTLVPLLTKEGLGEVYPRLAVPIGN
jgi:hypothetical protein